MVYLNNIVTNVKLVIWELGACNNYYAAVDISEIVAEDGAYFNGPDANIALFAAFETEMVALREWLQRNV